MVWFNTAEYTPLQLGLFAVGTFFWLVSYVCIIIGIRKNKFVEMPAGVICANITWEFIWAFIHPQNMGEFIGLGYKAWAVIEVYFIYATYKYGKEQTIPEFRPYFNHLITFGLVSWFIVQYFFIQCGYDNGIGANSAYIINILISLTYIMLIMRIKDIKLLSFTSGWAKGLGTGLISIMCFLKWPENTFLLSMCVICAVMDVYYIYIFRRRVKELSAVSSV